MADLAAAAANNLERRLKTLRFTLAEAARLRRRGLLTQRSLDTISTSTFNDSYAAFELFLEDVFFSSLLGQTSVFGAAGLATFASRAQAEQILIEPGRFLRWLPWDIGVKVSAERMLVDGLPFSRLERHDAEKELLEEARVLRNAIAHAGVSATSKASKYTRAMPAGRRHIAGYLQQQIQGQTRQEILVDNFRSIGRSLIEPTAVAAQAYLSPERPYESGSQPGLGTFRCTRCQNRQVVRAKAGKLPFCLACRASGIRQKSQWRRVW